MATYFVDLEKTALSADIATGATDITVDDASFINSTHSLKIGTEVYDIDSISGNTITLSSATTADYVTGQSVEIDDSNFDGLSPAQAKRTTIFLDGEDVNNHSYVWIKRAGSVELTENISGLRYIHMRVWPRAGEYFYDERPQEGIDAGWDSFSADFGININTYLIYMNGVENCQVSFSNFDYINASEADSLPVFYKKGGALKFYGCNISCARTHDYRGSLVRTEIAGTNEVWFYGCYVEALETSIVASYDSHDFNYSRYVYLRQGTVIRARQIMNMHCDSSSKYQGWNIVDAAENSEMYCVYVIAQGGSKSYINGYNSFRLRDTKVRTTHVLSNRSTSSYWGMSPIEIDIDGCDIETTSNMFHFYHRNYSGHESNGYRDWRIVNSRIVANGHIIYFNRHDNKNASQRNPLIFTGNEVSATKTMFYLTNLSAWGRLIFQNNKILNASKLIYNTVGSTDWSNINIKDAEFTSDMIDGGNKYKGDFKNVYVHQKLTTSSVSTERFYLENVRCSGIDGYGQYVIKSSTIESYNAYDPIPNSRGAVIEYSTIISNGSSIGGGGDADITLLKCNVEGDIYIDTEGQMRAYDCTLNGVERNFFERVGRTQKEISSIFRIGGASGSLKVWTADVSNPASSIISPVGSYELQPSENSVKLFFATPFDIDFITGDGFSASFTFVDDSGITRIQNATSIMEDDESSWDGLLQGENKYVASLDMSQAPYPIGEDRTVRVNISAFPPTSGPSYIYLDTALKGAV